VATAATTCGAASRAVVAARILKLIASADTRAGAHCCAHQFARLSGYIRSLRKNAVIACKC
jgi:hypothetical protein